jgi:hypothetical protein
VVRASAKKNFCDASGGQIVTQPTNGATPTTSVAAAAGSEALAEFAYANYQQLALRLGAVNTLLSSIPLQALLDACRRHQSTSILTRPANVSAEQAAAIAAALRNDEKIITAALELQRVAATIAAAVPG